MHQHHDTSHQGYIRTKIPPTLREVELGGKSKNTTPQTSPSPKNIPPLHFYTPYYPLAKEAQCSYSPESAHTPLESVLLLLSRFSHVRLCATP